MSWQREIPIDSRKAIETQPCGLFPQDPGVREIPIDSRKAIETGQPALGNVANF